MIKLFSKNEYMGFVKKYFYFLEKEYNYEILPMKLDNSLLFDVEYGNEDSIISISYEIYGEGVQVILFKLINGKLPNYDDKTHTIHLNKLMNTYCKELTLSQLNKNNNYFKRVKKSSQPIENELLKKAKELRLAFICQDDSG